jgi:hypothetical protein
MDAETRMERKAAAKDRKHSLRYRPKQVGRSVFTIQEIQAKRAAQVKGGRVEKPSRSHVYAGGVFITTHPPISPAPTTLLSKGMGIIADETQANYFAAAG